MTPAWPAFAIVRRELISTFRLKRSFVILALLVGACCAVTVLYWPENVANPNAMARISFGLVMYLSVSLLAGTALFMPAFAANSITIEKEQETYDLVHLSLVRPMGFILAKLLNSIGFFIMLVIAVMPVISAVFFLVGVDPALLLKSFVIVLLTAVNCAVIGITVSAYMQKTMKSIAVSYAAVMGFMGVAPIALFFLWILFAAAFTEVRSISNYMTSSMMVGSPVGTLMALAEGNLTNGMLAVAIAYQAVIMGVCLAIAARIIHRPIDPPQIESEPPIDDAEVLRKRMKTFPYYIIDPLKRKKPIEDQRNPMLVRELRWGLVTRGTYMVRLFYISFVIYFLVGNGAIFLQADFRTVRIMLLMQMGMTILVAPALVANSITKELELGNLDMLRMTVLSPRQIVLGKAVAGAAAMAPLLIAALLATIIAFFVVWYEWELMLAGYITLIASSLLCLGIGILASLLTRRTTVALIFCYIATLCAFFFFPPLVGVTLEALPDRVFPAAFDGWRWGSFLSPVMAFVETADDHNSTSFNPEGEAGLTILNPYWLGSIGFAVMAGLSLIQLAVWGFRRFRMQDS